MRPFRPVPQQDLTLIGVATLLPSIHRRPFAVARQRRIAVAPHGYPGFGGVSGGGHGALSPASPNQ
jgi:hypothetical protein